MAEGLDDKTKMAEAGDESGEEVISLDDIDEFLTEADPEFSASLKQIQDDKSLADADLEPYSVEASLDETEDEPSQEEESVQSWKRRAVHFAKTLPTTLADAIWWMIDAVYGRFKRLLIFFKTELPERFKFLVGRIKARLISTVGVVARIKKLTLFQQVAIVLSSVLILTTVYLGIKTISGGWLPNVGNELLPALSKVADAQGEFEPDNDMLYLYRAFPQEEFTVLLEKMVINFKRLRSESTPMGAFEFYIAVDSEDTAVEVKDREKEFLDYIQRSLEGLSYAEAHSPEGQSLIKALIRKEINEHLNQGRVSKVYIKTMITKP